MRVLILPSPKQSGNRAGNARKWPESQRSRGTRDSGGDLHKVFRTKTCFMCEALQPPSRSWLPCRKNGVRSGCRAKGWGATLLKKSFSLVFGVGAGLVATGLLASLAVGLFAVGAWGLELLNDPIGQARSDAQTARQQATSAKAQATAFRSICENVPLSVGLSDQKLLDVLEGEPALPAFRAKRFIESVQDSCAQLR